jgi:hypothetical protein
MFSSRQFRMLKNGAGVIRKAHRAAVGTHGSAVGFLQYHTNRVTYADT